VEDDAEVMEEDMEEDAEQQHRRRRKGKKVVEPDPDPLDDYPNGLHDLTLLTRYHAHVAMKASEGVVIINVIFYEIDVNLGETDVFFFEEAKMKYITATWKFQHK